MRYPGSYYNDYSSGEQNYHRPYEDNYRQQYSDYQRQPYPYRPQYEDYPRYERENHYAARYPPREPPYPPRPRYEEVPQYYRRESFSEYRDIPSKRRRARNSTYDDDPSPPRREKPRKSHHKQKTIREEPDSESDDYSANSDVDSIQSVKDLTDRTKKLSTVHSSDYSDDSDHGNTGATETDIPIMDYKEWTEQQKKEYHDRLELVHSLLADELDMKIEHKQPTSSGARGPVIIKSKPTTLPPAKVVILKYNDYLERAEQMIEMVDVVKDTKKPNQDEQKDKTQVESSNKVKLGLELNPFNPKWLYKLNKADWPQEVKPDADIKKLTATIDDKGTKEKPTTDFLITKDAIDKVQLATSLQMNGSSHIDWMLIAMKKLLSELQEESDGDDLRLTALQDLRYAVAYANEYLIDQAVFIHGGMTHLMREHYLKQMIGIEKDEHNELLLIPYQSKSAFNGHIPNVLKKREERDRSEAMSKLVRDRSPKPTYSRSDPPKSDLLQRLTKLKTKFTSSKVKKQQHPSGKRDKKKKSFPKSTKQDSRWKPGNQDNQRFPFNSTKFSKKKTKKSGGYIPKSGGRGRDHN